MDLHSHSEGGCTPGACNASGVNSGATLAHTDFTIQAADVERIMAIFSSLRALWKVAAVRQHWAIRYLRLENGEAEALAWSPTAAPSFNCELRDEFGEADSAPPVERPTDNNQEFQTASSEDEVVERNNKMMLAGRDREGFS